MHWEQQCCVLFQQLEPWFAIFCQHFCCWYNMKHQSYICLKFSWPLPMSAHEKMLSNRARGLVDATLYFYLSLNLSISAWRNISAPRRGCIASTLWLIYIGHYDCRSQCGYRLCPTIVCLAESNLNVPPWHWCNLCMLGDSCACARGCCLLQLAPSFHFILLFLFCWFVVVVLSSCTKISAQIAYEKTASIAVHIFKNARGRMIQVRPLKKAAEDKWKWRTKCAALFPKIARMISQGKWNIEGLQVYK